ncbi:gustatory receptor for sugar taste 64f-like [Diaphorina citri]|uniref:Gustatory receptor for sugar taste 64f-like n=1 Tax=Diaphorina citri TaxID=121845 RepID=A0A1S4EDZ4_DIACI|nr:gustatory receptor for sugar taste 64f-like [Diaphorina citri]KAI5735098.1 hypothetical protein M8J77_014093 [Diaphorina citri]
MESLRALQFKALLNRVGPLLESSINSIPPQFPYIHSELHSHEIINHPQDSFHSATRFPIRLYQILCLSPMSQAKVPKSKGINYRLIMSLLMVFFHILMALLSFIRLKTGGLSIFKSGSVLYFSGAALGMVLLIRVSRKWPLMITHWQLVEGYIGEQKYLRVKFLVISVLVILPSMVSHVAYLPYSIFFSEHPPSISMFHLYMTRKFPQVYNLIPYSPWTAGLILLTNFSANMIYCFVDQIILMSSLALAGYFEQFNRRLLKYKSKILQPAEWKTLRMNYMRLCTLTSHVDDCICHLLFLTFVIHVYILCVDMYQGLLNKRDDAERIHVILSFSVVLSRFVAICWNTVRVYEYSKTPLSVLYGVHQRSYCTEVELFTQQILRTNTCLSGSHMFSMNRNFLLTIAGTIITFELVLMQLKEIAASI